MIARAIAAMLVLLAVAAGVGCEHKATDYPEQPAMTDAGAVTYSYVVVHWIASVDDIPSNCDTQGQTWYGCAKWSVVDNGFGDTSECTLWAFKPRSFNDTVYLLLLGHEFFHCLGAKHERKG